MYTVQHGILKYIMMNKTNLNSILKYFSTQRVKSCITTETGLIEIITVTKIVIKF